MIASHINMTSSPCAENGIIFPRTYVWFYLKTSRSPLDVCRVCNTYCAKVNDEAVALVETFPTKGNFRSPDHSPTLHMQEPLSCQVICENMIQSRCHASSLVGEGG